MKDFRLFVKIAAFVLLMVCICLVPSCKKSPSEPPGESSANREAAETTPQPPALTSAEPATDDTNTTQETAADDSTTQTIEVATVAEKPGWVPIEIKLPKPVFIGTPQDTRVPNLEKPLGKERPPFFAPEGTKNVASGKPVSSSDEEPIIGELVYITDGDKEAADGSYVELGPLQQHIIIDLEAMYEIYAIVVWHHHMQAQVYFDVVVQVADDADFVTNVRTVFNNDIDNSVGVGIGTDMHYTETNEGKLIDAKGVKARYVRLYSNGNTSDDLNRYTEVEVYGRPIE